MNKSKFLKRSLAALLAILMVVAMIPGALAADDDETEGQDLKITVDTYSATRTADGDYEVTVWDSNDVTINWAPIPGTTLKLVTGGNNPNVVLDLPHKLYLAENANVVGADTYTVTLREKVGDADAVDHKLTIKVDSSIPDDDATLKGVRVDNAKGTYTFGYFDGSSTIPGYISDVNQGIEAHAIRGDIDNENETVTITLPFGMTPTDVGMGVSLDEKVFAPTSVHASADYKYNGIEGSTVTVTAKTGVKSTYRVIFKHEDIFESFANSTNLDELVDVTDEMPTLHVEDAVSPFVPEFNTTDNVMRIMGTSGAAESDIDASIELAFTGSAPYGEGLGVVGDGTTVADQEHMLKLITSGHANWTYVLGTNEYVYLLVRTAANPIGAWLKIDIDEPDAAKTKAVITELQVDNAQSVTEIGAADRTISVTVDSTHSFNRGNSQNTGESTNCYIHVTTNNNATLSIPAQVGTADPATVVTTSGVKRHLITGINAKSGSFVLRVTSEDKSYIDYTINLTAASSANLGLKRVELWDGDEKVASTTVQSNSTAPFEVEVPYGYQPGLGKDGAVALESGLNALQIRVFPDPGAAVLAGNTANNSNVDNNAQTGFNTSAPVIENGVTTLGDVWVASFTGNAYFNETLELTVYNKANNDTKTYELKLKRGLPDETAEIINVEANKALDSDYIYSVATTLGNQISDGGTPTTQTDIGQAYAGAIDAEGNKLPVTIDQTSKTIRISVPSDWEDSDTLYLYDLEKNGQEVYRFWDVVDANSGASNDVMDAYKDFDTTEQEDGSVYALGGAAVWDAKIGFTDLAKSASSPEDDNALYVVSQKDYYENANGPLSAAWDAYTDSTRLDWLKANATAYKMYIVKGTKDTGRSMTNASSADVTVNFRSNYDTMTVTVPSSYNWTSYRADDTKDFNLKFDVSKGALVIDKGQYEVNEDIADNSLDTTASKEGKYEGSRNTGTAYVSGGDDETNIKNEYQKQLNKHFQITENTSFFVLDGELYIYDKLSGKETQVTGVGGNFTNSNWGEIKTKQAEIQVWNAEQESAMNYRLDLVVGAPSSANSITSLKVGETEAVISGSVITATLPEGSDSEQALTIEYSDFAAASVNGEPYQASRLIDITKPVTIVVTAEDGTEATYTLTVTFGGGTTPDPDKPSSKYTDLDKVTNDTMRDYVRRAIDMGLMTNTGREGIFDPMAIVSRKDFAVIIARADLMANNEDITNKDEADARLVELYGGEDAFDDISGCNPTQKAAIKYCAEKSYIAGDGKGGFNPNSSIERQAAAIVLAKWRGLTVDESNTGNVNNVADWDKVANWAKPYVNAVMTDGLMSGTGNNNFTPAGANGTVNREQTAVMLVRVFDKKYPAFE